jgi:hypothetical protein
MDVVHSPDFKSLRLIIGFSFSGKEYHRDIPRLGGGLQATADFVAVHARHDNVQQDQVRCRHAFASSKALGPFVATRIR